MGSMRRDFLKLAAPAAVIAAIPGKSIASHDDGSCEYHAQKLADAMKNMHGGKWKISISHELGCAYVFRA
ncbi:hypothetical protein ACCZ74_12320 [Agrobacterium vitis]|uniref:hypothetical protein n=1 Tax=Agrobacterium vitis TaxID=373 RepID=UPI00403E4E97